MRKISKLCLCALALSLTTTFALADGMVFEPVDMPSIEQKAPTKTVSAAPKTTPAASTPVTTPATQNKFNPFGTNQVKVADMSLKENQDMQSALANLDCSQVEIRQNLQMLQQKYAEVDANYIKYKNERNALKKELKIVTKKIKTLDKVKNNIRKNML